MALFPGPWRDLHAAKNDLTAAKLLLHCSRAGGGIDVQQIEGLIMQASAKIDELSFGAPRVPPRPQPAPAALTDKRRQNHQRQAELLEQMAKLLDAEASALGRRLELASLLAQQKREEVALTDPEPERLRVEREAAAFERDVRVLEREIEVLRAQRERALAQASTSRKKTGMPGKA